jgi:hypothetical protein
MDSWSERKRTLRKHLGRLADIQARFTKFLKVVIPKSVNYIIITTKGTPETNILVDLRHQASCMIYP